MKSGKPALFRGILALIMLWNASCSTAMNAPQNGLDVPHSVQLGPNNLTNVQNAVGTAVDGTQCVLLADQTHILRIGELVQQVAQFQPTETGNSVVMLLPLKRGLIAFKAALQAGAGHDTNNCQAISSAFYDFAYGWIKSLILVWYFVLGNSWEIAWPLINQMLSGNEAQMNETLSAQRDVIIQRLGAEGTVLFDVLQKSAGIFFNPNEAGLVGKIDAVLVLLNGVQEPVAIAPDPEP